MESTRAAFRSAPSPTADAADHHRRSWCRSSRIAAALRRSGESVGENESGVGRGGVGCQLAGRALGAVNGRRCRRVGWVGGLAGSVQSD
jgi:hypothetical protein